MFFVLFRCIFFFLCFTSLSLSLVPLPFCLKVNYMRSHHVTHAKNIRMFLTNQMFHKFENSWKRQILIYRTKWKREIKNKKEHTQRTKKYANSIKQNDPQNTTATHDKCTCHLIFSLEQPRGSFCNLQSIKRDTNANKPTKNRAKKK